MIIGILLATIICIGALIGTLLIGINSKGNHTSAEKENNINHLFWIYLALFIVIGLVILCFFLWK